MPSSSRLLRKKQPVNYKPTPLNRALTPNDVSGNVEGVKDEDGVSPNHRDKVVTEDGRIFFPCPYCSRAFSELVNRAIHLNTCPAKSYILSVANAVKPEQTQDDKGDGDVGNSSQKTNRILEETHSFSEEEQRAFMRAVQLAKVNEIISENHYNMVLNRLGQRKRIPQKVKPLIHSPSYLKSYHLDVSPSTTSIMTPIKPKSAPKKTAIKKASEKPVAGNKSISKVVSASRKSPIKAKSAPTPKKPKITSKKSNVKKVRFAVQTPKKKVKPASTKNIKKNATTQNVKSKSKGVNGSVSPKNTKKVATKTKPSNPKTKSDKKKVTKKKVVKVKLSGKAVKVKPSGKAVKVKQSGKAGVAKSVLKSPKKVTKLIAPQKLKTKVILKPSKASKNDKKVVAQKPKVTNSKPQKPKKIIQKKKTVSKQIIITPSTDMNALEMKLADLVNLISDGSNAGSPRLSLKKDEKTGSLVITSETEVGKPKTPLKRPAQDNPIPAKKKKTNDKPKQDARESQESQSANDTSNVSILCPESATRKKHLQKKAVGDERSTSDAKDVKAPLNESISVDPKAIQTNSMQTTFENSPESHSEVKENKMPGNPNVSNTSKKQGKSKKKVTENKIKPDSNPKTESKKRSSLPKIVLKTVSGKKNSMNTANKNKQRTQAKKTASNIKINPIKTDVTVKKTKGKVITKPVAKQVIERNLKKTINKINIPIVEEPVDVKVDMSKQEEGDILLSAIDVTTKNNKTQTVKTQGKITKPIAKRISERNLKQTINKIIPNAIGSEEIVSLPLTEVDNMKQEKQGSTSLSVMKAQEVQTKEQTVIKPPVRRVMVRNLKQTNKMTVPNVEGDDIALLPLSKGVCSSKHEEQSYTRLSVIKTQELQMQSPQKDLLHNRKTLPGKKTKLSNIAAKTVNSPSKATNLVDNYHPFVLDVEEIPDSVKLRTTRSTKETLPKRTTVNKTAQQKTTSEVISIDDDIIELEDDVIELDVELPVHIMKEARTSKKPFTDEEMLSLLSLDNDTEVEYIVQNPVSKDENQLPSNTAKIHTKSQGSKRNAITIHPTSVKQKAVAKTTDSVKPSTSRIDSTSLIQELILNNIPRDDMHPRKLESYIKQFAAVVNAKGLSETASSDVEIVEDTHASTTNSMVVSTNNPSELVNKINVVSDHVVRTEEDCEGEEMDPLLLEDEEEDEMNSSTVSRSSVPTMGPAACKYCQEVFENPIELLRHKRQAHTFSKILLPEAKIQEYLNTDDFSHCPICQKPLKLHPTMRSKNKWSYIKHLNTHNKDMHFTCPKCDKKFKRLDHMKVHERRHY